MRHSCFLRSGLLVCRNHGLQVLQEVDRQGRLEKVLKHLSYWWHVHENLASGAGKTAECSSSELFLKVKNKRISHMGMWIRAVTLSVN